jgi:hypothetical protein
MTERDPEIVWFYDAIALELELLDRVVALGYAEVRVSRDFHISYDRMEYNVYFSKNEQHRERITLYLQGGQTPDIEDLMRQFESLR